jgi:hypothetical protein
VQRVQALAAFSILSAPVVELSTQENVGTFDVTNALRDLLRRAQPELLDGPWVAAHRRLSMAELQAVGFDLGQQPIQGC